MSRHSLWKCLLSLVLLFPLLLVNFSPLVVEAQSSGNFNLTVSRVDNSGFPEIKAYVTAAGQNGLPIPGLIEDNFQVTEDTTRVISFTVGSVDNTSEPVALAVALDLSGSMNAALSNTISSTLSLISQLSPADEMALITFTDTVKTAVPPSKDKTLLTTTLLTMTVKGDTALWDGVHEAVNALAIRPAGRRAVIVITDGQDRKSRLKLEDVASEAMNQHLPVFAIGFGTVDETALRRLAELTGGEAFIQPKSDQLAVQLDAILKRLRQQYVVTYTSPALSDGAEHRVTIRANYQGVLAEGQRAFIAQPIPFTINLPNFTAGQKVGVGMSMHFAPQFSPRAAITGVDYRLNGVKLTTVTTRPFEYDWMPTAADLGSQTLVLRATDAAAQTQEYSLAFEVVPAVAVSIVSPQPGNVPSGTVTLQADVTALSTVASVEFLVDNKSVGKLTDAPYTVQWKGTSGDHELMVVVTDNHGQSAKDSVTITVPPRSDLGIPIALAAVLVSLGIILPLSLRSRRGRTAQPGARGAVGVPRTPAPATADAGLVLEAGPGQGQQWVVGPGETRIGRQRSENDVILLGSEVSRKQAVIRASGGVYMYTSLSQSLPSLINGRSVAGEQRLADGDRIQIGQFVLRFVGPGRPSGGQANH